MSFFRSRKNLRVRVQSTFLGLTALKFAVCKIFDLKKNIDSTDLRSISIDDTMRFAGVGRLDVDTKPRKSNSAKKFDIELTLILHRK